MDLRKASIRLKACSSVKYNRRSSAKAGFKYRNRPKVASSSKSSPRRMTKATNGGPEEGSKGMAIDQQAWSKGGLRACSPGNTGNVFGIS